MRRVKRARASFDFGFLARRVSNVSNVSVVASFVQEHKQTSRFGISSLRNCLIRPKSHGLAVAPKVLASSGFVPSVGGEKAIAPRS